MSTRAVGRPRNPCADQGILQACKELLAAVGYAGLSIEAVAVRAGVGRPTVYRRYPGKAALVFEAVFGQTKPHPVPDTGNLKSDLEAMYTRLIDEFSDPATRAAVPGLLADLATDPAMMHRVSEQVIEPESKRVLAVLERARERGEIRADIDLRVAVDALAGTALARATLLGNPLDHAAASQLVALIVAGLRADGTEAKR